MELIYRESKHDDERLVDYIERLAFFNGYHKHFDSFKRKLASYGGELYPELSNHDSIEVYAIERIIKQNLYAYGEEKFSVRLKKQFSHEEVFRSKKDRYKITRRICAKCWFDKQYVRSYWYDDRYEICHIHIEPIVEINGFDYLKVNYLNRARKAKNGYEQERRHLNFYENLIKIYTDFFTRIDRSSLDLELDLYDKETSHILSVTKFFQEQHNVALNYKGVKKRLDEGSHIGLEPEIRLDYSTEILSDGDKSLSNHIRFILALFIIGDAVYLDRKVGYRTRVKTLWSIGHFTCWAYSVLMEDEYRDCLLSLYEDLKQAAFFNLYLLSETGEYFSFAKSFPQYSNVNQPEILVGFNMILPDIFRLPQSATGNSTCVIRFIESVINATIILESVDYEFEVEVVV